MELFLQQFANGVALGSTYAMFGMGFGLVFATMNLLNIAHGSYATWGAVLALYALETLKLPFPVAIAFGFLVTGVLGIVVDQIAFEPLRRRGGGLLGPIITSIGANIILMNAAQVATEARIRTFPTDAVPSGLLRAGELVLPIPQAINIAACFVILLFLHWLLQYTRIGAATRAVGWNAVAASLSGINSRLIIIGTAFMASAVAGLAGMLSAAATSNVSFTLGEHMFLKGFAAVVIGGYGDVRGAALGGIFIGLAEVLGAQYVSNNFRDAITFGLLVIFLLARPRGFFGKA